MIEKTAWDVRKYPEKFGKLSLYNIEQPLNIGTILI